MDISLHDDFYVKNTMEIIEQGQVKEPLLGAHKETVSMCLEGELIS